MPLFEEKERNNDAPKARTERLFSFYDRSSRPEFDDFRRLINQWVDELPASIITDISGRMRSDIDLGFDTALTEILIHASLTRLGFQLTPHPEITNTTRRPDFLICDGTGTPVAYIEVTTINPATAELGRDTREGVVFEALNDANIPEDLRLSYGVPRFGAASPSVNRIRAAVERWSTEHAVTARNGNAVEQDFEIDDWSFRLALLGGFRPRPGGRKIAFHGTMNGHFWGAPRPLDGLARALDQKSTRYGILNLPYIVVVFDRTNSLGWFTAAFAENVTEVLFGTERNRVIQHPYGQREEQAYRDADGWYGQEGNPRNTNVSAVLVFPDVDVWHLQDDRRQPLFVRHPWASRPLPQEFLPFKELLLTVVDGQAVPGRSMADILELPDPWPPVGT